MVESPTNLKTNHLWPTCGENEVKVMILGTYHMANPGLDEVNIEADDVLAEARQTELANLAERLRQWDPDRVAVEWPVNQQEQLTNQYRSYRDEGRAYDSEPADDDENETCVDVRSEVVQIGFRVALGLELESVTAVDERPDRSRYEDDPFDDRSIESTRKTDVRLPEASELKQESQNRLTTSTIPEYLAWMNQETQLRISQELMFDQALRVTEETFGSPLAVTMWYERNIRILHHIWRTMTSTDERILLIFGSGHVTVLRHLMSDAPMFCPVSPLPMLPTQN